MSKFAFEPSKLLNPELIRINLLLASLYLTAFETLKVSIIEGVRNIYVHFDDELMESQQNAFTKKERLFYQQEMQDYEKQLNVKYSVREQFGLIPSCKWLNEQGVLAEEDIELVKQLRKHRNLIAHELPNILLAQNAEVDLELFNHLRTMLRKVDLFWAKTDILINPETLEEINLDEVKSPDIWSGREIVIQAISDAVVDYVSQLDS